MSKGTTNHKNHNIAKLNQCALGQDQLTTTMVNEITKLEKGCASAAIQQNVLMANNEVSIPRQTLINKRISLQENDYDHTDAEAILQTLKDEPNITYFAMYA